jgi:hypothetical protein
MRSLLPAALLAVGCSPPTELASQRAARLRPDAALAAGALLLPPEGAVTPRNLAAVVVRLSEAQELRLRPAAGPVLALGAPEPDACEGGAACFAHAVPALLAPATSYAVELALGGPALGVVTTGTELDRTPPRLQQVRVEPAADCLRVRFSADEPVRAAIVLRGAAEERAIPLGAGGGAFDLPFRPALVEDVQIAVRARDWAGNLAESVAFPVAAAPPVPALVITEVLANPAGPETTQEYVELRNLGTDPLAMQDFVLENATHGDPLPAAELGPGRYALVVSSGYDASEGHDPPPAPGTQLLRLPGRIGGRGVGNAGEAFTLRRRAGPAVSRYGGWLDVSSTKWAGRGVHRSPQDACDHPGAWSGGPATPGS